MNIQISIFTVFSIILLSCSDIAHKKIPIKNPTSPQKNIIVHFKIDDSTLDITNKYELFLINLRDTQKVTANGLELIIPTLTKDTGYTIYFIFNNYRLSFSGVTKKMILPDQDIEWIFGIENKPFNRIRGLLSDAEYKKKNNYKQLQYFQFNPMENGDGIQFVKKIE